MDDQRNQLGTDHRYSEPCDCGGTLLYLGEDSDGRDVWHCQECDHREYR